jgi:hypothetical protein
MKKTRKKKLVVKIKEKVAKSASYFVASEMADDAQVEKEILGQSSKATVYEFTTESNEIVRGLSLVGVREAVRVINGTAGYGHKIRIAPNPAPKIERDISQNGQNGVEVWVYAEDTLSGGGQWGIKFEPWQKVIDAKGSTMFNSFAVETALSKAQRNAMFALLPSNLVDAMIDKFSKQKGAVETIKAPIIEARIIKPQATAEDNMFKATLERVDKVKADKVKLEEALTKIENMPLTDEQKAEIKKKLTNHLKKLK